LVEPAEHIGKTYTLHGPIEMNQAEIAAAVTNVIGRKVTYQPLTISQYRKQLEAADFARVPDPALL
jgi:NAD(P)H dehydrogenase (quinone)